MVFQRLGSQNIAKTLIPDPKRTPKGSPMDHEDANPPFKTNPKQWFPLNVSQIAQCLAKHCADLDSCSKEGPERILPG